MRLATFLPPGGGSAARRRGPRRRGRRFADGTTVLDRLASGDRSPGRRRRVRARRGRAARARRSARARSSASASTTPSTPRRPGAPARGADRLHEAARARPRRPNAPMHAPAVIRRLDYEGELAVVMGAGGEVAGYAVADDVSARDLQRREPQWTRAKGFDGSCPYGPWITTADELGDPHDLALRTWVNGELRQDSRTSDLIFKVPRARRVHQRDLHARARRPDPHRHAERRRHGAGPAAVPGAAATSCASRSSASARSSTLRVTLRGARLRRPLAASGTP